MSKKREYLVGLIQYRVIKPHPKGLPDNLLNIVGDRDYRMSKEEATAIYEAKQYENSLTARVNATLGHMDLWGLIITEHEPQPGTLNQTRKLRISQAGRDILSGRLDFAQHMETMLPLWKFPNYPEGMTTLNPEPVIRPFPATLALIFEVNRVAVLNGFSPVGVYADEFDLYGLSFRIKNKITDHALQIIAYRKVMREPAYKIHQYKIHGDEMRRLNQQYSGLYNAADYSDVVFRYFNLSRFIELPENMSRINIAPEFEQEAKAVADSYMLSDEE